MARDRGSNDGGRRRPKVGETLATGVKDLPSNASWLVAKALSPLSAVTGHSNGTHNGSSAGTSDGRGAVPRVRHSAIDAVRSTTALVRDSLPGDHDSVEMRLKRAHDAADAARAAEQRAVAATEEADRLATDVGQARIDADRRVEATRSERQAEADRRVEEVRAAEQEKVDRHVQKVTAQAEADVRRRQQQADEARVAAESALAEATDRLEEARRLSDEATAAAQRAAEEAQQEADRLAGEARDRAKQARKSVAAAQRTTARTAASASRTATKASPAKRSASKKAKLDALPKKELVSLAAAQGVEGRSSMTKDELVKALR